ncbi:helix-turn-helix domain-containing protein [Rossellomorea arthrocnemi]
MIGTNISNIRKRRGLTLSELADRSKVSKSYLSNLERNLNQNPSIQVIEKIAGVLNVNLNAILHENDDIPKIIENEWLDFIYDLKESGIEKEQINEFKTVIEFINWQQGKVKKN